MRYLADSSHRAVRGLMLSWLLVVLIFFSIPTSKLVGYILPALAPFAFFLAEPFVLRLKGGNPERALRTLAAYLIVSIALCAAAVVALIVSPQPSSKGLAQQILLQYRPEDKIAMLQRYRYDLDFYLGTIKSSFVVSNWDDPAIKRSDNWRKELYDAGQFEPEAAERLLITPREFIAKLCAPRVVNLWLVGDSESVDQYPFLTGMPSHVKDGKLHAWRVPAGPALSFCAEKPKSGSE